MRARLVLVLALEFADASGARAEALRAYHNDRFGTSADVPADWRPEPSPENNDGRVFTSPDGNAQAIVSGSYSVLPRDEEFRIRLEPNDGETIQFRRSGRNWVVVSGVKDEKIFYRKSLLSCRDTIWNSVSLEYPAAGKKKYDALVAHVSASLRPGSGYGSGNCR